MNTFDNWFARFCKQNKEDLYSLLEIILHSQEGKKLFSCVVFTIYEFYFLKIPSDYEKNIKLFPYSS